MNEMNMSRNSRSSMTRRHMLAGTLAATLLGGEGALGTEVEITDSPSLAQQKQRQAFLALWLLLSGREGFFVIDTTGGNLTITVPQQAKIESDLKAFFANPDLQMQDLLQRMKGKDPNTGVAYYTAFQAARTFFHSLGTESAQGGPVAPYQPGEVCGKLAEIMTIAGVSSPQTKEATK